MKLSNTKSKIFQEETFRAHKNKKNLLLKYFLYFEKWNFPAPKINCPLPNTVT